MEVLRTAIEALAPMEFMDGLAMLGSLFSLNLFFFFLVARICVTPCLLSLSRCRKYRMFWAVPSDRGACVCAP